MHYDFAVACAEPPGPAAGGIAAHTFRLLAAHAAAGRRCAAFVSCPPDPEHAALLGEHVTFVNVPAPGPTAPGGKDDPELNHSFALCMTLLAFLRENTVRLLEFPAPRAEGFYFIAHNLVHRLVPEIAVRVHTPTFLADEDTGRRTCSLHRAFVYAAEIESILGADHVLCDEEALLARVLAAFDPRNAREIRMRCSADTSPDACERLAHPPTPVVPPVRLGVVIPHWNDAENLSVLLGHLHGHPAVARLEIVVVDDGSPDPVRRRLGDLARLYPHTTFLSTAHPRSGPFTARRLGLDAVAADLVAFVDSDDLIDPGLYLDYAQAIAQNPLIDVIIPGMDTSGWETHPWVPKPKARFTAYFSCFAHAGLAARKHVMADAFALAATEAADVSHAEDSLLSLALLFNGARILSLAESAYHYRRNDGGTRSQTNTHRIEHSRLARDRFFDRCMSAALAGGSLTPLDLVLIRQIALALPPEHSATQIHTPRYRAPWHTHLYRAWRSLLGDPRYG
jgi:hypothetical protein